MPAVILCRKDRKMIDLHTHTTASDGSKTPRELVKLAKEAGLTAVAVTDHDNIDGLSEAVQAGEELGICVIPGIELSAKFERELHIVGLFIDFENEMLVQTIAGLQEFRRKRNDFTLRKLQELGFALSMEEVRKMATGNVMGRAHFARAMVKQGYVESTKEAFQKYLGNGRPAYSANQMLTPRECIALIHQSGGLAFLAHCHFLKKEGKDFTDLVDELVSYGLDGLEGFYTEYTPEKQKEYLKVCQDKGLLVSGGSDYHGVMKPDISIGSGFGGLNVPDCLLDPMRERLKYGRKEG